jgi:hypothetical protein
VLVRLGAEVQALSRQAELIGRFLEAAGSRLNHRSKSASLRDSASRVDSCPRVRRPAAHPFGRVPLFVRRQRVGRKRAPLRRPSGTRDESAHSRARGRPAVLGDTKCPLKPQPGLPWPGVRGFAAHPPGLVVLGSAPQKGFLREDQERKLFSTSSYPVRRSRASQPKADWLAECPQDAGTSPGDRDGPSGEPALGEKRREPNSRFG